MINNIVSFIIKIFDPFILLPPQVKTRVEQEENNWINLMAVINHIVWPIGFSLIFFLSDYTKPHREMWAICRFGAASTIIILGVVSYICKTRKSIVVINLYLTAAVMSLAVSWSMSFVGGYVTSLKWVVLVSAGVLLTISRSLIIPVAWLMFTVLFASPLWIHYALKRDLISDATFAVILIIFGHVGKRIWIQSKVNQFLRDDAVQESIEHQRAFDNEIKRFISPVLVKRIEEKTATGQSLVMALDEVLMRKEALVAVLFTDIRNFSVRSIDVNFVENELIPSSSKIIDSAENNMGVAKQIGDAVFIYYSLEDVEEGVLRALKDAVVGCRQEKKRVESLGREKPERFFSLTYGPALVGNMASFHHREATVIGSPANLAARIDTLTKEPAFNILIADGQKIALSEEAANIAKTFHKDLEFLKVDLNELGLTMKSFPDEKNVYLLSTTQSNIAALNEVLVFNKMEPIAEL